MARLTEKRCAAARYTKGKARILWDSEVKGFGLRLFPSGAKSFIVEYRPQDSKRKRQMTLGSIGELSVDDARDLARKARAKVRTGADPLLERRQRTVATFGELATKYLEEYAKPHRKSWREDERRIEKRILPALGRLPLTRITSGEVRKLHLKIGRRSPVEANRTLQLVRAIFNRGRKWGIVPANAPNPTAGVDRFRERSRERWLNAEELQALAEALDAEPSILVSTAIRLLALTGCRKTELLRARWERVDFDNRRMLLEDTKTGDPKTVPLSAPAVALLQNLPRLSAWVFPSPVNPMKPLSDLKRPWERIRKLAGIPDARIHDLRRTAGSWLVQRGVPLGVVGAALGHKDHRSTLVYARIAAAQPAEALDLLGDAFGGLLAGSGQA